MGQSCGHNGNGPGIRELPFLPWNQFDTHLFLMHEVKRLIQIVQHRLIDILDYLNCVLISIEHTPDFLLAVRVRSHVFELWIVLESMQVIIDEALRGSLGGGDLLQAGALLWEVYVEMLLCQLSIQLFHDEFFLRLLAGLADEHLLVYVPLFDKHLLQVWIHEEEIPGEVC